MKNKNNKEDRMINYYRKQLLEALYDCDNERIDFWCVTWLLAGLEDYENIPGININILYKSLKDLFDYLSSIGASTKNLCKK